MTGVSSNYAAPNFVSSLPTEEITIMIADGIFSTDQIMAQKHYFSSMPSASRTNIQLRMPHLQSYLGPRTYASVSVLTDSRTGRTRSG